MILDKSSASDLQFKHFSMPPRFATVVPMIVMRITAFEKMKKGSHRQP